MPNAVHNAHRGFSRKSHETGATSQALPSQRADIPSTILLFLAKQLNLTLEEIDKYDWNSRTSRIHRAKIREVLGYREPTTEDAKRLRAWLIRNVMSSQQKRLRVLCLKAYSFLRY